MSSAVDFTPMIVLLSTLLPLGFVGTILGSIALLTHHRRVSQSQRIGGELVKQMLERGMQADEIERILLAWGGDHDLAAKLLKEKIPPMKKYVG